MGSIGLNGEDWSIWILVEFQVAHGSVDVIDRTRWIQLDGLRICLACFLVASSLEQRVPLGARPRSFMVSANGADGHTCSLKYSAWFCDHSQRLQPSCSRNGCDL